MKVVILAGGIGSRISEETLHKPKPMVEIGGKPILWHLMKLYTYYNITDFIICCGYKGYIIKEYFANYFLHNSDITIKLANNQLEIHQHNVEPWTITLVDTGDQSMTGGRLKRVKPYLDPKEAFCFTYGDGLSDINLTSLIQFHQTHQKLATITTVLPPGRYGAIQKTGHLVTQFVEKPKGDGGLISGGFFVLSPKCLEFINDDFSVWEEEPLKRLVEKQELMAFEHHGFWHAMDTLRDKNYLEKLWQSGNAPWKLWN